MKKNVGSIDRMVRILVAFVVAVLYITDQVTGLAAIILGVVAVIFLVTSSLSFCPIYAGLKVSTNKETKVS